MVSFSNVRNLSYSPHIFCWSDPTMFMSHPKFSNKDSLTFQLLKRNSREDLFPRKPHPYYNVLCFLPIKKKIDFNQKKHVECVKFTRFKDFTSVIQGYSQVYLWMWRGMEDTPLHSSATVKLLWILFCTLMSNKWLFLNESTIVYIHHHISNPLKFFPTINNANKDLLPTITLHSFSRRVLS